MVSIVAFQAVDPGSIPGRRKAFSTFKIVLRLFHDLLVYQFAGGRTVFFMAELIGVKNV